MKLVFLSSTIDHRIVGFIICGVIILASVSIIILKYIKSRRNIDK